MKNTTNGATQRALSPSPALRAGEGWGEGSCSSQPLRGFAWLTYLSTALVTIGVKQHYSHATVADLAWILAPTATVVGWLRRQPLVLDASLGWMAPDGSFVIAPACAGINFLIVAFTVSVVGFVDRFRSARQRGAWFVAVSCAAYLLTIAVNTLRIIIAISLYATDVDTGWLTPERLHRLAGSAIYLAALWAIWIALDHLAARWVIQHPQPEPLPKPLPHSSQAPLKLRAGFGRGLGLGLGLGGRSASIVVPAAYLGMTVVLPLLNGAWQHFGVLYLEHAITVSLLVAGSLLLLSLGRWFTSGSAAARGDTHEQADDSGGRRRAGNC